MSPSPLLWIGLQQAVHTPGVALVERASMRLALKHLASEQRRVRREVAAGAKQGPVESLDQLEKTGLALPSTAGPGCCAKMWG